MRRLKLAAVAILATGFIGACSNASVTKMTACRHDGEIRAVKVQSVNAAFLTCRDGRVYRYDTGNG